MVYTGKKLGDFSNRAFAFDTTLRFGKAHSIRANFIGTSTDDPETGESYKGNAFAGRYVYSTKKFVGYLDLENYGKNFRMDTAFYSRTGVSSIQVFLIPIFAVKSGWLKAVRPVAAARYLYDHTTSLEDRYLNFGVVFEFIKQGMLTIGWDVMDDESWEGTTYDTGGFWGNGSVQLTKWLSINFFVNRANHIYYDGVDPFLGKLFSFSVGSTFQPLRTLSFRFNYQYTDFDRKSSGEDVYDYHIFYSRTTFQPNKHLFFRALIQYDSDLDQVMSDILASYEFVPGTVFHIGYGSLHEKLAWDAPAGLWRDDAAVKRFYQTSQSFFLKISYRLQF